MGVSEYINDIPRQRKTRFQSIITIIKSLYPLAVESMRYKMPTYELGGGWVAVANQKNYISVYTCSAEHIANFKKKYPKIKTGKGCINFRDNDEIPKHELEAVIKSAIEFRHN